MYLVDNRTLKKGDYILWLREKMRTRRTNFLLFFFETKKNIDETWPEWKKSITPLESTASNIIRRSNDEKAEKSSRKNNSSA